MTPEEMLIRAIFGQPAEYGIRTSSGRVIVGPGWESEADVMASMHGHGDGRPAATHGELVRREHGSDWELVR